MILRRQLKRSPKQSSLESRFPVQRRQGLHPRKSPGTAKRLSMSKHHTQYAENALQSRKLTGSNAGFQLETQSSNPGLEQDQIEGSELTNAGSQSLFRFFNVRLQVGVFRCPLQLFFSVNKGDLLAQCIRFGKRAVLSFQFGLVQADRLSDAYSLSRQWQPTLWSSAHVRWQRDKPCPQRPSR